MLVADLVVMPSDAMPLYCKDNGTIAFAKELRSHQISKHIEQQNTRLSQVEYIEVQRANSTRDMNNPTVSHLASQRLKPVLRK